jgi:hypothetical protein
VSRADRPGATDEPVAADPVEPDDEDEDDAGPLERQSLPGALRRAVLDFFYNSIRLVPANVLWGVVLIGLGWLAILVGVWLAILGLPLLGLPLVGIYRLAGHITRGEEVVLSDVVTAARQQFLPALGFAAVIAWGLGLFAFNATAGLASGSPLGWLIATLAGWGFVALAIFTVVAWPVLADPARTAEPARQRLRLAGYLVLAAPFRMAALTVIAIALWVVSTIAFAALVTITVSFVACLSCRVVLPDADRLAEQLEERGRR